MLKWEDLVLDAKIAARTMEPDKMVAIIRIFKDTHIDASKMTVQELRWELQKDILKIS